MLHDHHDICSNISPIACVEHSQGRTIVLFAWHIFPVSIAVSLLMFIYLDWIVNTLSIQYGKKVSLYQQYKKGKSSALVLILLLIFGLILIYTPYNWGLFQKWPHLFLQSGHIFRSKVYTLFRLKVCNRLILRSFKTLMIPSGSSVHYPYWK